MKKYFYKTNNNLLIDCTDRLIKKSGYFLAGYQNINDKGKLYLMVCDNGTCLTPVFNEKNEIPCFPQFAGKELKELFKNPLF